MTFLFLFLSILSFCLSEEEECGYTSGDGTEIWYYCYPTEDDCENKLNCDYLFKKDEGCKDIGGGIGDLDDCETSTTVYYTSCTSTDCQSGCPTGVTYGDCNYAGIDGYCRVEGCDGSTPGGGGDDGDEDDDSSARVIDIFGWFL